MKKSNNKGFTLIELLVVIAIIGLLSTLAVVALNSARTKSRDARRVADMKQITSALALYYDDNRNYPTQVAAAELGQGAFRALCTGGWKATCAMGDRVYMGLVPGKPIPNETGCNSNTTLPSNLYLYTSATGATYTVTFCLGGKAGELLAGGHTASQNGIQ
jgi:prepilin-type N-terminal cleavage/methylation domain-containing protein